MHGRTESRSLRSMRWIVLAFLAAVVVVPAAAQEPGYGPAREMEDFGVPPVAVLRTTEHSSPTPLRIPGGSLIGTQALRDLVANAEPNMRPLLIDVLGGSGHASLPGTVWLPDAGRGTSFEDATQRRLADALQALTAGERARPLVFFCQGPRCWLSYNAALRAIRLGYAAVHWYRGGIEAWLATGGILVPPRISWERLSRD